jgi:hypothetical protein
MKTRANIGAAVAAAIAALGCADPSLAATPTYSSTAVISWTPNETLSCGAPGHTTQPGASNNSLYITIQGNDPNQVYTSGSKFNVNFKAVSQGADYIVWSIADYTGAVHASGAISVPAGTTTATLPCSSTLAGYFAVSAKLRNSGATQPWEGSRPAGYASFGVLPNVADYVPQFMSSLDTRRFGMVGESFEEGATGFEPLNEDTGTTWVMVGRSMTVTEPNYAGQFNPATQQIDPSIKLGSLARVIAIDGIPNWASTAPATGADGTYPPKSFSTYQNYAALVGEESARIHNEYIPNQHKNYYQVTWEPNPGPPTQWKGTDAQMVQLYQAAYEGVHSTDPDAAVMGPAASSLKDCIAWIPQMAPYGWANYVDAVSCHGYYTNASSSAKPPEPYNLPGELQELRSVMAAAHVKAGAKLIITETGIGYPEGSVYAANYPTNEVLEQHAEAFVRTHLIMLGEGVDTTFLFYAADFLQNTGFGLYFNLSMSSAHNFESTSIAPKPATMAVAAATRLVDGSRSLGALTDLPTGGYGYAFRLPDNTHAMIAVWAHNSTFNASIPYAVRVEAPGTSGITEMFDTMGNPKSVPYTNGLVQVQLSEMPIYVRSKDIAAATTHVRVPEGYDTSF